MIEEAFKASILVMPSHPLEEALVNPSWIDMPICKYLSIAALLLFFITFIPFLRIFPTILECNLRGRLGLLLEHNLSQARTRNLVFVAYLFIFILLCDRFRLIPSPFTDSNGTAYSLAICSGTLIAYLLLRWLAYSLILPRNIRFSSRKAEACAAARHMIFNSLILMVTVALAAVGILLLFGTSDSAIRTTLWVVAGLFFLTNVFRTGEILHSFEGLLTTFLYLCGLELIPIAALIASTLI